MTRYAIYFAPEAASLLWRFGSSVIGYDAATGGDVPFAETAGLTPSAWSILTEDPRRYGFHATLKAPFTLSEGVDEAELIAGVMQLAETLSPVTLFALKAAEIGRFLALVPSAPSADLQDLASAAVEKLDQFRAPLTEADRARRLQSALTPRQIGYLDRHGYPYVHDEFRFHMTLTGPIGDATVRANCLAALSEAYARFVPAAPVSIDAMAIYRQERRDARFRIIQRVALTARR
jgi:putative phosphonate metabolism protein